MEETLQRNNFKHNQRRVASIKYLGELYNFQTVDAKVILDCLWILVTFGHREPFFHQAVAQCSPPRCLFFDSRWTASPRQAFCIRRPQRLVQS